MGDPLVTHSIPFWNHIFSHVFYRLTTQCLHGRPTGDPLISLVITKLSHFFLHFAWWHTGDPLISLLITDLQQFHYLHVFNELTTYFCMGDSLVTHWWLTQFPAKIQYSTCVCKQMYFAWVTHCKPTHFYADYTTVNNLIVSLQVLN